MNLNKHSKVRAVGLSCFLALTAVLGVAVFCPFDGNEGVYAAPIEKTGTFDIDFVLQAVKTGTIDIDFLLAPLLSVSVDNLPANVTESVTPTASGQTISKTTSFSVTSNSTAGYGVYVTGSSSDLNGTGSNKIVGTSATKTSLAGLDINTWGYNLTKGTSVTPATLSYKKLATAKGTADDTGAVVTNQQYQLTFGAKVGYGTAADTYTNTVNVNVVASGSSTTALSETYSLRNMVLDQMDAEKAAELAALADEQDDSSETENYDDAAMALDGASEVAE